MHFSTGSLCFLGVFWAWYCIVRRRLALACAERAAWEWASFLCVVADLAASSGLLDDTIMNCTLGGPML
jgi:hypothetical protein